MAEPDPVLGLLDDLVELLRGSVATSIEVSADSFSVAVTRDPSGVITPRADQTEEASAAAPVRVQQVHATGVGIFSATRSWSVGERITRGELLGAIQSLGHMSEIAAPADGTLSEVLVSVGAPVEYGQTLFAITLV